MFLRVARQIVYTFMLNWSGVLFYNFIIVLHSKIIIRLSYSPGVVLLQTYMTLFPTQKRDARHNDSNGHRSLSIAPVSIQLK